MDWAYWGAGTAAVVGYAMPGVSMQCTQWWTMDGTSGFAVVITLVALSPPGGASSEQLDHVIPDADIVSLFPPSGSNSVYSPSGSLHALSQPSGSFSLSSSSHNIGSIYNIIIIVGCRRFTSVPTRVPQV